MRAPIAATQKASFLVIFQDSSLKKECIFFLIFGNNDVSFLFSMREFDKINIVIICKFKLYQLLFVRVLVYKFYKTYKQER
jgi:hypothetical protein